MTPKFRRQPQPPTLRKAENYTAFVGIAARVDGVMRFLPTGAVVAADDPILRTNFRGAFVPSDATTQEIGVAQEAYRAYKEAMNPRPEPIKAKTVPVPPQQAVPFGEPF